MNSYLFNSASVASPYSDEALARQHLKEMLDGLGVIDDASKGALPTLRVAKCPWEVEVYKAVDLSTSLSMGALAESFYETNDYEYARYFSALSCMFPESNAVDDIALEGALRLLDEMPEIRCEENLMAIQLAGSDALICAVSDFVLVSMLSDQCWDFFRADFFSNEIGYGFFHAANARHANEIVGHLNRAERAEITQSTLMDHVDDVFPNIKFGNDVGGQIPRFPPNIFRLMLTRLDELNAMGGLWLNMEGPIPDPRRCIVDESDATMDNYGSYRRFHGHDGVIRTFRKHIWIDKGNRIHLYLHEDAKTVEVGYIGKHLPTVTFGL